MAGFRLLSVTGPEPVDEQQFRRWARISDDDDTATVTDAIKRARECVEMLSWRQIVRATYRQTYDWFPDEIRLYRPPLIAVQSVQYLDADGEWQTLDPDAYVVDTESEPGRIALASDEEWPDTLDQANAVIVEFTAGYATAAEVPGGLRQLVLDVATLNWQGKDVPSSIESRIADYRHGAIEVAG